MEDVQLTEFDNHVLIKGRTRDAVEAALADMLGQGHQQLETTRELGNNWIATVRLNKPAQAADWCEVTPMGLQFVIEASAEKLVNQKVQELTACGAVLIAGPECVDGKWMAVVDQKGVAGR